MCLKPEIDAALLLVRNHLDRRPFTERHLRIIERADSVGIQDALCRLGFYWDASSPNSTMTSPRWSPSPKFFWKWLWYAMRAMWGRMGRTSSGMNVIFYGPDGVGKSTQADRLVEFFKQIGMRRVTVFHSFVEAKRLSTHTKRIKQVAKTTVYGAVKHTWVLHLIILASYLQKLFWVVCVLRPRAKRGDVLIHDRYLLDVFQKATKVRGIHFTRLERALARISSLDPCTFVLHADSEIVAARKNELSPEEIARSYGALFTSLKSQRGSCTPHLIDANRGIENVHRDVVERVLEFQATRTPCRNQI
jgi:thymidylate kinase